MAGLVVGTQTGRGSVQARAKLCKLLTLLTFGGLGLNLSVFRSERQGRIKNGSK